MAFLRVMLQMDDNFDTGRKDIYHSTRMHILQQAFIHCVLKAFTATINHHSRTTAETIRGSAVKTIMADISGNLLEKFHQSLCVCWLCLCPRTPCRVLLRLYNRFFILSDLLKLFGTKPVMHVPILSGCHGSKSSSCASRPTPCQ